MSPGPPLPSSEGRWMRREIDRSIARAWIHIVGGGREVTDSHYHSGSSRRHSGLDPCRSGLDSLPHTAATTRRQSATAARHRWGGRRPTYSRRHHHSGLIIDRGREDPQSLLVRHRWGEGGPRAATHLSSICRIQPLSFVGLHPHRSSSMGEGRTRNRHRARSPQPPPGPKLRTHLLAAFGTREQIERDELR
jgi:hypothetical protein